MRLGLRRGRGLGSRSYRSASGLAGAVSSGPPSDNARHIPAGVSADVSLAVRLSEGGELGHRPRRARLMLARSRDPADRDREEADQCQQAGDRGNQAPKVRRHLFASPSAFR